MRVAIACLLLALVVTPASAQVWNEQGDAGDLPATAQVPQGAGPLLQINGTISGIADADMYLIELLTPTCFVATTCNPVTPIDTQLWLFDQNGMGATFDDDDPTGCGFGSLLSRITGTVCQIPPGCYFLAVSGYNNDALDAGGGLIWNNSPFNVERCPDVAGAGAINSWDGGGFSNNVGPYSIDLTCVTYCAQSTPVEPTTWGHIKSSYR